MRIREILDDDRMVLGIKGTSKKDILVELATPIAKGRADIDRDALAAVLLEREEASSTAIADGIAIPHGRMPLGDEVLCAFGRSASGVDFDSVDGQPTNLFFVLVSPADNPGKHLRWLGHIAGLLKDPALRRDLLTAETPHRVLATLAKAEEGHEQDGPR
jgi:mannitol/fructose-specific phosphotransferase system IIA component (Ntr-type)